MVASVVRTTAVALSISQAACMAASTTVSQAKDMVYPVKAMASRAMVSQDKPTVKATEESQAREATASPATLAKDTEAQDTAAPGAGHQTDTAASHTAANSPTAT